jgi:hypothetical protein
MASGSVKVKVFRNRLRLAWSWQDKRFCLYMGLSDPTANRKLAEIKALTMAYRPATLRTRHG